MKKPHKNSMAKLVILTLIGVFVISCGGGDGIDSQGVDTLRVDASGGNDLTADGSPNFPFQTITAAVEGTPSTGGLISIAPGVYDMSLGELFPIVVPSDTALIGSGREGSAESITLIRGSGTYSSTSLGGNINVAIVLGEATGLSRVRVESPGEIGILAEDSLESAILNSAIVDSLHGVVITGSSTLHVQNSLINSNQNTGIETHDSSSPVFINNTINNNGAGILVRDSSLPKFGAAISGGNNSIVGNINCDLRHLGSETIVLIGTLWDDDVFDFSVVDTCTTGANIVNQGIGSIDFQFAPAPNVPLFAGTSLIDIASPTQGGLLFTNDPGFIWSASGRVPMMIAIWDEPPIVTADGIANQGNIVWVWHPGLATGIAGFVKHSEGIFPSFPDLRLSSPPLPLEPGRSYYWAVWEWDSTGVSIERSSTIAYFRTQP